MAKQDKYRRIPVEKLELDPQNPRLPKSIGDKSESEIINYFLSDTSLVELMLAIGKNDFFEGEQLLVVPNGNMFKVIEGNRRLSAVKLLHHPEIATIYKSKVDQVVKESEYFPTDIPCLVFDDKNEILKYLGYRHITGIKSWKLLEKARYLTKLKKDFYEHLNLQESSREIAKMIGSRQDYVRRILVGYEIYEIIENNGFYNIKGLDDTNFHFNYIADSLSRSKIEAYLGVEMDNKNPFEQINYEHIKEWTNWLFDYSLPNKIIGDSEHLNALNKVLSSPSALKAFKDGERLFKALEFTDDINNQFRYAISEAIDQIEKADGLTHRVTSFYPGLVDDLKTLNAIIRKIKTFSDEFEAGNIDGEL